MYVVDGVPIEDPRDSVLALLFDRVRGGGGWSKKEGRGGEYTYVVSGVTSVVVCGMSIGSRLDELDKSETGAVEGGGGGDNDGAPISLLESMSSIVCVGCLDAGEGCLAIGSEVIDFIELNEPFLKKRKPVDSFEGERSFGESRLPLMEIP